MNEYMPSDLRFLLNGKVRIGTKREKDIIVRARGS